MIENKLKNLKNKVSIMWDDSRFGRYLFGLYLGTTIACNVGAYTIQATGEAISNQPKEVYSAKLVEKGWYNGINTKSEFSHGIFETKDGRKFDIIDGLSVLDGKLIMNNIIPKLEVGKDYEIVTRGNNKSFGFRILEARLQE